MWNEAQAGRQDLRSGGIARNNHPARRHGHGQPLGLRRIRTRKILARREGPPPRDPQGAWGARPCGRQARAVLLASVTWRRQSASRHLRDLGSARSTDALRIALPPDGRIGARPALAIDLLIKQAKLAFEEDRTFEGVGEWSEIGVPP
jgi:hypothetical protein